MIGLRVGASLVVLLVAGAALLWLFGPREPLETDQQFDAAQLSSGVDPYLVAQEARFDDIRPGAAKRVLWRGSPGTRTSWAVVYLHGFSASAEEVRPLPDRVAARLDANLVFTRLAGHGRDGKAMATATATDWMADVAEALAIGRSVGDQVLLIGTSTGGTLAALAAFEPMSEGVAGIVFLSPNFRVRTPGAALLASPGARWWLPHVMGRERAFEPINPGHAAHWTTRYPIEAVLPMAAAVAAARRAPHAESAIPALFLFDPDDRVVDHAATRAVADAWGAPATVEAVAVGPADDPSRHVIAGDILSPSMTDPLAARIADWAALLP